MCSSGSACLLDNYDWQMSLWLMTFMMLLVLRLVRDLSANNISGCVLCSELRDRLSNKCPDVFCMPVCMTFFCVR